jgi:hypothetical protein
VQQFGHVFVIVGENGWSRTGQTRNRQTGREEDAPGECARGGGA